MCMFKVPIFPNLQPLIFAVFGSTGLFGEFFLMIEVLLVVVMVDVVDIWFSIWVAARSNSVSAPSNSNSKMSNPSTSGTLFFSYGSTYETRAFSEDSLIFGWIAGTVEDDFEVVFASGNCGIEGFALFWISGFDSSLNTGVHSPTILWTSLGLSKEYINDIPIIIFSSSFTLR